MRSRIDSQNRINNVIETTLKNLSEIVDVNTVVGTPIKNEDELIIPISKVTVGVLAGGGEYGKLTIFKNNDDLPFSAGNGAIISLKPCGFLVKDKNAYKLLSVSDTSYERIIDKITNTITTNNDD